MNNIEILTNCFLELGAIQLGNLKYHLENETPIFCGIRSDELYLSDAGYAWPAVLASTREVEKYKEKNPWGRCTSNEVYAVLWQMKGEESKCRQDQSPYLNALIESSEADVRQAIGAAIAISDKKKDKECTAQK